MKYRLVFFLTVATLLIHVGLSTSSSWKWYMGFSVEERGLICLIHPIGPPIIVLLVLMNLLIITLYFQPENDFAWWLNLVGLFTLMLLTTTDFTPDFVLAILCFVFGLAYRRHLGLKHIWHWRGLCAVIAGFVFSFSVASFGMDFLCGLFE